MSEPSPPRQSTRETRLLLVTLAVSVAALLLLARFRFPERPLTDLSTPQPLTRLTRVTAFDELSAMLRDLLRQFEGAVVLVRVSPGPGAGGNGSAGSSGGGNGGVTQGRSADAARAVGTPRDALGLLVRDDLALVPLPAGGQVDAVAGSPLAVNGIVARDEQRGLAVVRVPGYSAAEISIQPPATPLDAPGYVAILEAGADGPTIRAEFVSRYSTEPHAGWDQPVLALSGPAIAKPGSLLFTLAGRLVGMTLADSGRLLVVPADTLMARATRLANGESIVAVESGIEVQPMTPGTAKATGATEGVIISEVSAEVAADSEIAVGDVITTAAERPVRAPRDWQQILRAQGPGATIKLSIVRFGKPLQTSLTLPRPSTSSSSGASEGRAATAGASPSPQSTLDAMGLTLRGVNGASEIIAIRPASPAARAGLRAGDRITSLPGRGTPTAGAPAASASASPNAIAAACAELASGQALLLAINRDGTPRIIGLEKP